MGGWGGSTAGAAAVSALPTLEQDWQATVIEAAERLGWRVYHTYDARRSTPASRTSSSCGRRGCWPAS